MYQNRPDDEGNVMKDFPGLAPAQSMRQKGEWYLKLEQISSDCIYVRWDLGMGDKS